MITEYLKSIGDGEAAMRKWMEGKKPSDLPSSVWDAPTDCPLWGLGLSLAQAGGIWAKAKAGGYSDG